MRPVAVLALLLWALPVPAGAQPTERIQQIQVHGNHTTPEAVVLELAGLAPGEAATPERLAAAEAQLRRSGRFAVVEVRRRYASLTDPSAILVVVVVNERPACRTRISHRVRCGGFRPPGCGSRSLATLTGTGGRTGRA